VFLTNETADIFGAFFSKANSVLIGKRGQDIPASNMDHLLPGVTHVSPI
jgi:hypothetical protein